MDSENNNVDEINTGLRSVLGHPLIYNFFQILCGSKACYRKFVGGLIKPIENNRILDIGCGTAEILNSLPKKIHYVGYDKNEEYIRFAKKKYGDRAKFYNQEVSEMTLKNEGLFDIVLATALLHHLNDDDAIKLFKTGYAALKNKGRMVTFDNAYLDGQSKMARFIAAKDRGRHVRYPKEYGLLAKTVFANVDVNIRHNMIRIPQTSCMLICKKEVG